MPNIRLALRTLTKTPFVTAVAVSSLALGIGANAAIFSIFEQVLMRPLPVAQPDRLVNFASPGPKAGSVSCGQPGGCDEVFSYLMFRDLAEESRAFAGIAAHSPFNANLSFRSQSLAIDGLLVSGSYFPVLGVNASLGRLLGPADDTRSPGEAAVVLSHRFWETQFGGDPTVLNQSMVLNGQPATIVGVAPPGFDGTTLGAQPRVFVPIAMQETMTPGFTGLDNRRTYWLYLFGRLAPGVTTEAATASINAIYRPVLQEVEAPLQTGMSEQTLAQFQAKQIVLAEGRRGQSSVHGDARPAMLVMFGIAGIVLLIACANIANLLLARGANRGLEIAVRQSLGASRAQLVSQLMMEALILALFGGVGSLVVARWTLSLIGRLLPPEAVASFDFGVSPAVIAFAAALSIATGVLFGVFPAIHTSRAQPVTTIRANSGQIAGARTATRFRAALVTAQIALSMMLLVSAGLFIRSLLNISRTELGLNPQNVVTFRISPQLSGYEPSRIQGLVQRLEEELSAQPGVTAVSASAVPLLSGSNWGRSVRVEGYDRGPDGDYHANYNVIGADFFRTLGITLLAGREFGEADHATAGRVAVVNEAFARKFDLYPDPVGRWMAAGGDELDIQIVGLVRDAGYSEVKDAVPPQYFTPYRQDERLGSVSFYARTAGDPQALLRSVYGLVGAIDPNLPVQEVKTLPQQVRENTSLDRMIGILSAGFAAVATLLAAIGLYGVLAFAVSQRTREIGVRMALGARAATVRRLVLGQVGWMLLVGGTVGLLAAYGLGRAARSLLFGIGSFDPVVTLASIGMLVLVALLAALSPARRAARVDPMTALRSG